MAKVPIKPVSVIIPAYNQGNFLLACLESVLNQTTKPAQIIVVNDGSTDNTALIAKEFLNKITYVEQRNSGLANARNTGIKIATSQWLAFLDADDIWKSTMLERCFIEQAKYQSYDVIGGGWEYVNEKDKVIKKSVHPSILNKHLQNNAYEYFLLGNAFPIHSVIVKHALVQNVGGFNEKLKAYEDWDLWLKISEAKAHFFFFNQIIASYRRHLQNMTRDTDKLEESFSTIRETHIDGNPLINSKPWLKHYAMAFQWLFLAEHSFESKAQDKTLKYLSLAEDEITHLRFDLSLKKSVQFIALLTRIPDATQCLERLSSKSRDVAVISGIYLAFRRIQIGEKAQGILSICKIIWKSPILFFKDFLLILRGK